MKYAEAVVIGEVLFNVADCVMEEDWISALSHAESAEHLIREVRKNLEQKVKEES